MSPSNSPSIITDSNCQWADRAGIGAEWKGRKAGLLPPGLERGHFGNPDFYVNAVDTVRFQQFANCFWCRAANVQCLMGAGNFWWHPLFRLNWTRNDLHFLLPPANKKFCNKRFEIWVKNLQVIWHKLIITAVHEVRKEMLTEIRVIYLNSTKPLELEPSKYKSYYTLIKN